MKPTAIQIIGWYAYIDSLINTGNKAIIIGTHDRYAYDIKFVGWLSANFMHNFRDNGSKVFWIDTARKEPMTEKEQQYYILPLTALSESDLSILCKYAGITKVTLARYISKINMEVGV